MKIQTPKLPLSLTDIPSRMDALIKNQPPKKSKLKVPALYFMEGDQFEMTNKTPYTFLQHMAQVGNMLTIKAKDANGKIVELKLSPRVSYSVLNDKKKEI